MERFAKVAKSVEAATGVVPESVPAPALVPMAMTMVAEELVTVFEKASCTVTWTAGVMDAPAVVAEGCTVNASLDAAAALTLKPAEVAAVSAPEVAVSV